MAHESVVEQLSLYAGFERIKRSQPRTISRPRSTGIQQAGTMASRLHHEGTARPRVHAPHAAPAAAPTPPARQPPHRTTAVRPTSSSPNKPAVPSDRDTANFHSSAPSRPHSRTWRARHQRARQVHCALHQNETTHTSHGRKLRRPSRLDNTNCSLMGRPVTAQHV